MGIETDQISMSEHIAAGTVEIQLGLAAGWNWISVNATQDNMDINTAFSNWFSVIFFFISLLTCIYPIIIFI